MKLLFRFQACAAAAAAGRRLDCPRRAPQPFQRKTVWLGRAGAYALVLPPQTCSIYCADAAEVGLTSAARPAPTPASTRLR
eukprot:4523619-Heterocapsa_arctica.AAC.1